MNSNNNIIRSAANGMNNTIIRPATKGMNTAATEVNKTIIRPATKGMNTAATEVNKTIIRPATKGMNTAATEVNKTIIKPAAKGMNTAANEVNKTIIKPATNGIKTVATVLTVEPIVKLRNLVIIFTEPPSDTESSSKASDDDTNDSLSQAELSESEDEEEEEEEPIRESAFQCFIVDGQVDSEALAAAIHEMYSEHVASVHDDEQEDDTSLSVIGTVLDASTLLLYEFTLIDADQDMVQTVQTAIEDYIFPRISLMYTDVSSLRASEVARLISFADMYNNTMTERGLVVSKDRLAEFEGLATDYLRRAVHDQMKIMVSNSLELRTEEELRLDGEGNIVTGNPDDVSFMMTMQLTVARDNLPPRFLSEVLTACNHELENMVGDLMIDVMTNWKQRTIEQLCASVNDAAMLIEMCDDLNQSVLDPNNSEHMKSGDDLLKNLTELSLHSVRFVCERIMLDCREPVPLLTRVGSPSWEQQEEPFVGSTLKTLGDYFGDIRTLIMEGYYFPKVLKNCFDMTIETYVESFFANTMAKGIKDPLVVSQELLRDWSELNHFFCESAEQADYLGHAGHHSEEEAAKRLGVVQALSFLMTPGMTPSKLETEIKSILRQFGTEAGIGVLLHIAGLRNRKIDADEAAQWHIVTKEAVEELAAEGASGMEPIFTVPDLRDSKHIARVRGASKELDESIRKAGLDNLPPRPSGIRKRWGASALRRRFMKSDDTLLSSWKLTEEEGEKLRKGNGETPEVTEEVVQV